MLNVVSHTSRRIVSCIDVSQAKRKVDAVSSTCLGYRQTERCQRYRHLLDSGLWTQQGRAGTLCLSCRRISPRCLLSRRSSPEHAAGSPVTSMKLAPMRGETVRLMLETLLQWSSTLMTTRLRVLGRGAPRRRSCRSGTWRSWCGRSSRCAFSFWQGGGQLQDGSQRSKNWRINGPATSPCFCSYTLFSRRLGVADGALTRPCSFRSFAEPCSSGVECIQRPLAELLMSNEPCSTPNFMFFQSGVQLQLFKLHRTAGRQLYETCSRGKAVQARH